MLNSFCSLDSFNSNFCIYDIHLNYLICDHGGPIYPKMWMMRTATVLAFFDHVLYKLTINIDLFTYLFALVTENVQ